MVIEQIDKILSEKHETYIKIGYIKEVLQTYILSYIYNDSRFGSLIFYGGTAMRFCHNLNRLSEDLDFIGIGFTYQDELAIGLQSYFAKIGLVCDFKHQKFRTTLKFHDLLSHFDLKFENSNDLYLKIEISDNFEFATGYHIEFFPIQKYDLSLFIRSLNISDLMGTKLNAVLYRTRTNERKGATFKGRDIYDLFRYLTQKIKPNLGCVDGVDDIHILKTLLVEKINSIDFDRSINDIQFFIENQNSLDNFKRYAKDFMLREIASR
ncbi:MAG TPA: nucleotidyl transferase AbiEii/AbiGii toxin family protein [Candidatus Absconditabacterales bacterium]|nr:nucleotidyl transferase AbiEii/AbiGii toxin family protein [Candidatus Absconditabacterales bacterium]HNG97229.1 nucleotidyl transferase AbiEii/AbiGii toxin family protein [Candidatus Absconditabacterales bacterium]